MVTEIVGLHLDILKGMEPRIEFAQSCWTKIAIFYYFFNPIFYVGTWANASKIKILTAANYFRQKIDGGTTVATVTKVVEPFLDILKGMGP